MKIKAFGELLEHLEGMNNEIEITFPISFASFKEELVKKYPHLAGRKYVIAINQQVIKDENYLLAENDVVALLPPFSGG